MTLAPLALPVLKAMLAARVILELPEPPEPPGQLVPLVVSDQLGPLALLVLTVRPQPLVVAC